MDDTPNLVRRRRIDHMSMRILDAFASACVANPTDSYAVTYEVVDDEIVLYIASTGARVPANVVDHLESVWESLKTLGASREAPGDSGANEVQLSTRALYLQFVDTLYRFS